MIDILIELYSAVIQNKYFLLSLFIFLSLLTYLKMKDYRKYVKLSEYLRQDPRKIGYIKNVITDAFAGITIIFLVFSSLEYFQNKNKYEKPYESKRNIIDDKTIDKKKIDKTPIFISNKDYYERRIKKLESEINYLHEKLRKKTKIKYIYKTIQPKHKQNNNKYKKLLDEYNMCKAKLEVN